jgi:hypothetical protein
MLYVQHLVLALHCHAFAFVSQTIGYLAMHLTESSRAKLVLFALTHATIAAYLCVALRRFYGSRPLATLGKLAAAVSGYALALILAAGAVGLLLLVWGNTA